MTSAATIGLAQRYNYALDAGFSSEQAAVMAAISTLECSACDMSSINSTGDVGLWQINRVHWGSNDPHNTVYGDLTDPATSAKAAFQVWKGAGGQSNPVLGYQQWCTYPGGCGGASPTTQNDWNNTLAAVIGSLQLQGTNPGQTGVQQPPPSQPGLDSPAGAAAGAVQGAQQAVQSLTSWTDSLSHILQQIRTPGFWWTVLLFGAALAAIGTGVVVYFKSPAGQATLRHAEGA